MIKGAFKQRMIGAIFILSLGVIFIPVILDMPSDDPQPYYSQKPNTPALPEISEVAQINYVFNEIEGEPQAQPQIAAQEPAVAPAPKSAPVIAAVKAPEPPQASPARPTVRATAVHGDWTIQLGAFSSADNAKDLLQKLSQKGFQSYLKETPGKKMVRVFVGPGVEKDKAQAMMTQIDSQLGLKGIIVRYQEPTP